MERPRSERESVHVCYVASVVSDSATPWTIKPQQAPLSMGFSRQEYWSGLPCPPPGDLRGPGIEPVSPACPALAGGFFTTSTTWEAPLGYKILGGRTQVLTSQLKPPVDPSTVLSVEQQYNKYLVQFFYS